MSIQNLDGMVPFNKPARRSTMTVKELIEKLKEFDENLKVNVLADGGTFCLDDAVIGIEIWHTKDGRDIEMLDISFD